MCRCHSSHPVSDGAYKEVKRDSSPGIAVKMNNGFKPKERKIRLDVNEKFLPVRVVSPWHGFP